MGMFDNDGDLCPACQVPASSSDEGGCVHWLFRVWHPGCVPRADVEGGRRTADVLAGQRIIREREGERLSGMTEDELRAELAEREPH
jgi:hypothetical protein